MNISDRIILQDDDSFFNIDWPSLPMVYFPDFCSGPCTGLTKDSIIKIYEKSKTLKNFNFKLEDVLFTGILRQKAGLPAPADFQSRDICHHGHSSWNSKKDDFENLVKNIEIEVNKSGNK